MSKITMTKKDADALQDRVEAIVEAAVEDVLEEAGVQEEVAVVLEPVAEEIVDAIEEVTEEAPEPVVEEEAPEPVVEEEHPSIDHERAAEFAARPVPVEDTSEATQYAIKRANAAPSNWAIEEQEDETIVAVNSVSKNTFAGTMEEFNNLLRSFQ